VIPLPHFSTPNAQDLLNRFRTRLAQSARQVARATNEFTAKSDLLSAYNTRITKMMSGKATRNDNADSNALSGRVGSYPQPRQTLTIDGLKFKRFVQVSYLWLRQQESIVNSYNVYPVPDGDTGTNMMHTMRSAWEACANVNDASIGAVVRAVSMGAIRGSRGNSGIILSQIWRGFSRSIDGKSMCTAKDMAAALREAANTAYAGVNNPVEGTMLTVARETADAAERAAAESNDMRHLLDVAAKAAYESVQRTPNLLKILKEAGVVDSGGYGLYVILDGMRRFANGEPIEIGALPEPRPLLQPPTTGASEGEWGYDVQYLIYAPKGQDLDVETIRRDITAMGECPLIMGDGAMVKVHVHVPDPGVPLSYGARLGSLRDVVVEDMQAQSDAFTPGQAQADRSAQPGLPEVEIAIVAVASGDGIMRAFKDVGARAVVVGGQTMNPSVDDLLKAIKKASARHVILLPNNSNIIMTAQQAAELSDIPTQVIPTKTIPQGIAAAIAFNFERDMQGNLSTMNVAAQQVVTAEVTTATRTVTVNGVSARAGDIIGLLDYKLVQAGVKVGDMVLTLLEQAQADSRELITLYYGNNLPRQDAEQIAQQVRAKYPSHVVDLYEGQQAHYYFVIGIE
jgi:DAK2 domain fusion protein YloV